MEYYSQHDIDKIIHQNFISKPFINGSFLELGALDGVRFSNTKFFEDNMGFNKGVLIEPDTDSFQKLVKNRPNCQCFNTAIHSSLEKVVFLKSKQLAVGCIEAFASDGFKEKWHKNSEKVTLPASTLASVLKRSELQYIDFFSLDVEGAEYEVLKSMAWEMPVGLLCIEINNRAKDIELLLRENEFALIKNQKAGAKNKFYFNKNYFRKDLFSLKKNNLEL